MSESEVNHGNVLSAQNVTQIILASLSKSPEPQLRNPFDAIALLCHACMLAVDFRLIGLGEDHKIEATSDAEHTKPLPPEWNSTTTSDYAFRYAHTQSTLQYLIKVSRLGRKAVINSINLKDQKLHSAEVRVNQFISESSLPYTRPPDVDDEKAAEALQNVFISIGTMADLAAFMRTEIIQKLAPKLHKEGYEESVHAISENNPTRAEQQPAQGREPRAPRRSPPRGDEPPPYALPRPFQPPDGPEITPMQGPVPSSEYRPREEDEHRMLPQPPRPFQGVRRPLNIGEGDLNPAPLYPHDPLRVPGYGGMGGGGMHPTLGGPLFGGDDEWDRYDPRAPPGARYDPINPGDGPPNLRGGPRFPGRGGGFGGFGGGGNPFGGFGGNDFI
ncbi:hypothetical protein MMC30_003695 [Trapelia coarctata]|nr:hypothetical protein [Trapelia coarctata]